MPFSNHQQLLEAFRKGQVRALARLISLVENESTGSQELLQSLQIPQTPIIGVTGPPGAGKSTLVNALIGEMSAEKRVGIIAVDPTSPFNFGALLGDRIRMNEQFQNQQVYIRSLASRGSLGGLSDKILEIADVMRAFGFDYIFIETVGVGQSEVDIAGVADTTVVVMVPEAGDHIQTMKAGLMEIADIFVVNKADRPDAEAFASELSKLIQGSHHIEWKPPVLLVVHQNLINQNVDSFSLWRNGVQNRWCPCTMMRSLNQFG
jgi:LAO/AO transport system kinase